MMNGKKAKIIMDNDHHPTAAAAAASSSPDNNILTIHHDDNNRRNGDSNGRQQLFKKRNKRRRRRSYTTIFFVLVLIIIYGFTSTSILIINSREEAAAVESSKNTNNSQNDDISSRYNNNNNNDNYKFDGESSILKSSSSSSFVRSSHHHPSQPFPRPGDGDVNNHHVMKERMRIGGRGGGGVGEIVSKRRRQGVESILSFESIKNLALLGKKGKEIDDEEEEELDDVVVVLGQSKVGRGNFTINIYNKGTVVPRLPVIDKPIPIPSYQQVEKWMSTPGNQSAGQFMIDFAILGFAKCGTSTMMFWLGKQREIFVPDYEITNLQKKHTVTLVEHLYRGNHTSDPNIRLRGYKSPNDIMDPRPARILGQFFNQTKLIIGIRHPIYMIESFYNHRIQNGLKMPPLEKLTFKNMGGSNGVTLGRASYHSNLLHLGKTNLSKAEMNLMPRATKIHMQKQRNNENFPPTTNKVYLYDTAQLSDKNQTRHNQVLEDLSNFLGLNEPLADIIKYSPGKVVKNETHQAIINSRKVQICDDRYKETRRKLIRIGIKASQWILQYFLSSPDVYVSNVDHFIEILYGYTKDPCISILNLNKFDKTNVTVN